VTLLALCVLAVTAVHAWSEYRGGALMRWLAADVGFRPRAWLAGALFVLACVNVLAPLAVAVAGPSDAAWAVVAGALLADALCTHILPTLWPARRGRTGTAVPGIRTAPLQLAAVAATAAMLPDLELRWLLVGVALFAPLRLLLLPLAWRDRRAVGAGGMEHEGGWLMDKAFGLILVVALVIAAVLFEVDRRNIREYDRRHAECIAWATNHVYPDGRRVADVVDPEAWCQE
jgi:hypothetical protein